MKTGSLKKTYPRLILVSAALVMAIILMLSASMAEAKHKKHHHRPPAPAFNVVQCTGASCPGTAANDFLIGTNSQESMTGEEGNDVYEGNGGGDQMVDLSTTSSDTYVLNGPNLGSTLVGDCGGGADTVDLSSTSFRLLDNVTISRGPGASSCPGAPPADELFLSGPEGAVTIVDQYGVGKIETIKFANGTLTF